MKILSKRRTEVSFTHSLMIAFQPSADIIVRCGHNFIICPRLGFQLTIVVVCPKDKVMTVHIITAVRATGPNVWDVGQMICKCIRRYVV